MKIAIVEDELSCAQQMQAYLRRFGAEHQRDLDVVHYPSGTLFLQAFKGQFDMILLDISMPGLDGMETAHRIRALDSRVVLLFVTNLAQYAIRGYEVDASDYILKPVHYFAFSQRLSRAIGRISGREEHFIFISHKSGAKKLTVESIRYVESVGHNLVYHTAEGTFTASGAMKDAELALAPYHFFRCNKGLLVALPHVDGVTDGCALVGGEKLPVSRPRKSAFLDALANYIGGTV